MHPESTPTAHRANGVMSDVVDDVAADVGERRSAFVVVTAMFTATAATAAAAAVALLGFATHGVFMAIFHRGARRPS